MKTIGIVGSRRRNKARDEDALRAAFDTVYEQGDRIVSGGCPLGADRMAEALARDRGITIIIHYPRKEDLDPAVPHRVRYTKVNHARNGLIARDCDVLIALVAEDRKGGTEDTVRKAKRLGKKIILV